MWSTGSNAGWTISPPSSRSPTMPGMRGRGCRRACRCGAERREEDGMPRAERTIVINRSPDEVFRFFSTPANDLTWRKGVKEIDAQGPIAVGTKVHQVVAGPGGRSIAADIEVTAYDPPTRY